MPKIRREYRTEDVLKLIGQYGDAKFNEGEAFGTGDESVCNKQYKLADNYLRQLKELLSL